MPVETFEVTRPGLLTTVQDLGRYGYQQYGVPVSGAMDSFALRVGNLLVDNDEGEAGLEITLVGPELKILEDTVIAITGGDLDPTLDGKPLPMWETVLIKKGSKIAFQAPKSGCRAYLTVTGGIDVPKLMEGKSTYIKAQIGGLEGRTLRGGDRLKTTPSRRPQELAGRKVPKELIPAYTSECALRVVMGPQDDLFTEEGVRTFLASEYVVTPQSDRMGYRLTGPKITHKAGADIISDGIPLGAVQVPGDGMPIIMLADRQTTGGYTKIATVITADISKLAQAKPGDKIRFDRIGVEEAHAALREYEQNVQKIKSLIETAPTAPKVKARKFRVRVSGRVYEVLVEDLLQKD
jgi:biotin-dependent carboxylase-like uncharacterized protein